MHNYPTLSNPYAIWLSYLYIQAAWVCFLFLRFQPIFLETMMWPMVHLKVMFNTCKESLSGSWKWKLLGLGLSFKEILANKLYGFHWFMLDYIYPCIIQRKNIILNILGMPKIGTACFVPSISWCWGHEIHMPCFSAPASASSLFHLG